MKEINDSRIVKNLETRVAVKLCKTDFKNCLNTSEISFGNEILNLFDISSARFRQYTGAQRHVSLPDGEMVHGGGGQRPLEGTPGAQGEMSFSIRGHIAGSSVPGVLGIFEDGLRVAVREIRAGDRCQS